VARPNGSRSYLTLRQEQVLLRELRLGPSAHGWEGQGWAFSRIARVIEDRFGVRFTVPACGTSWTVWAGRGRSRKRRHGDRVCSHSTAWSGGG
jgi:hypothetical protein